MLFDSVWERRDGGGCIFAVKREGGDNLGDLGEVGRTINRQRIQEIGCGDMVLCFSKLNKTSSVRIT